MKKVLIARFDTSKLVSNLAILSMQNNGFRTFQSNTSFNRTCYDDDISNQIAGKTDNDLAGWLFNTRRLAARLLISPDPSKGDPVALSEKLEKRADQMELELKKREALREAQEKRASLRASNGVSAMPIKKKTQDKATQTEKTAWVKQAEALKTKQYDNWKVTTAEEEELRCKEELEGSPISISQRIEHEGKIFIE